MSFYLWARVCSLLLVHLCCSRVRVTSRRTVVFQHLMVLWEFPFPLHEVFLLGLKVYVLVFCMYLLPISTCISRNREAIINNHQNHQKKKSDFSSSEGIWTACKILLHSLIFMHSKNQIYVFFFFRVWLPRMTEPCLCAKRVCVPRADSLPATGSCTGSLGGALVAGPLSLGCSGAGMRCYDP